MLSHDNVVVPHSSMLLHQRFNSSDQFDITLLISVADVGPTGGLLLGGVVCSYFVQCTGPSSASLPMKKSLKRSRSSRSVSTNLCQCFVLLLCAESARTPPQQVCDTHESGAGKQRHRPERHSRNSARGPPRCGCLQPGTL